MKLLCKEVLLEYGFTITKINALDDSIIMTKDNLDLVIKYGNSVYYENMGFDYPLKDLSALKKLYKEVRSSELKLA